MPIGALDRTTRQRTPGTRRALRRTALAAVAALVGGLGITTAGVGAADASAHVAGYPYAVSDVVAKPGGLNQVVVTWKGGGRATGVGVIAGGESTTTIDHFHTQWYAPGTHRIVLTVPSSMRHTLGANTGNYVFVRVVQTNATSSNPVMHLKYSIPESYRISRLAAAAMAGGTTTATGSMSHITFGELNTQSIEASSGFSSGDRWSARAPRVVKTIEASHPDVVTTAELETHKLNESCENHITKDVYCATQASSLAALLKKGSVHYAWATSDSYRKVLTRTAVNTIWQGKVTEGAQIFYNPEKMTLVKHGYISPAMDLHVPGWTPSSGVQDRWWSWAELKLKSSGRTFLVVAAHFPAITSAKVQALHAFEAKLAGAYIDSRISSTLPTVLAGDFNADPIRNTNPNSRILLTDGYHDAAATTNRTGARYETFNGENGTGGSDYGYPVTAVPHRYNTSRIDFILMKRSVVTYSYANVLHIADGKFIRSYQGTDHDLQLAHLGIGDPS